MAVTETETLASIRQRLEALVEARLKGLSGAEQREYQQLIEREAVLLKEQWQASPESS